MKKYLKEKVCYFFGHKYNEIALDHGCCECLRCGRFDYSSLPGEEFYDWRRNIWLHLDWNLKNRIKIIKWKIQDKWNKFRGIEDECPF